LTDEGLEPKSIYLLLDIRIYLLANFSVTNFFIIYVNINAKPFL